MGYPYRAARGGQVVHRRRDGTGGQKPPRARHNNVQGRMRTGMGRCRHRHDAPVGTDIRQYGPVGRDGART